MGLTKNHTLTYVAEPRPDELIDQDVHFELVQDELDLDTVPLHGGVLVKTLLLSSEPYLRYRFRGLSEDNYWVPRVQLGFPVDSTGIGKVVRSDDPCFKPGDVVIGYLDWSEYCVYPGVAPHFFKMPMQKLDAHPSIPYSTYLGVLGYPGHAAYSAWKLYLEEKLKTAQTMYVSAGASTVGTFVIEYTKLKAPHVKIIASAGTDEKVELMRLSGAAVPFNYVHEDIDLMLRKHGPVDIFWDNVGGRTLDAALANMNESGLVLSCGSISTITSAHEVQNWDQVSRRHLTVQGFVCYNGRMADPMSTFFPEVVPLVVAGTISRREHRYVGIARAAAALCDVHSGRNRAKAVVVVADE